MGQSDAIQVAFVGRGEKGDQDLPFFPRTVG